MKLHILTFNGYSTEIEISSRNIKAELLKKQVGSSNKDEIFVFNKKVLQDYHLLRQDSVVPFIVESINKNRIQIMAKSIEMKKMFVLEVENSECIADIKERLTKKIRIKAKFQIIKFDGKILNNDKTVEECGIKENSVIDVDRESCMITVFVKSMRGRTYSINIDKYRCVFDLKRALEPKVAIESSCMKLIFAGRELLDDDTLSDCGVMCGSTIQLVLRLRGGSKLLIKFIDGKVLDLPWASPSTTAEVKQRIFERSGFNPREQILKWNGEILKDEEEIPIECYNSTNTLTCIIKKEIVIKTSDGNCVSVYVLDSDNVAYIKGQLEPELDFKAMEMRLFCKENKVLEDHKTVADIGIEDPNFQLYVAVPKFPCVIRLKAIFEDDSFKVICGWPKETIYEIKSKIHKVNNMQPDRQRIIFQNNILEDDQTVKCVGFIDRSVINVLVE